ncbi:mechanosensitive ion channel [Georgenia sp. TF02-10]|uniref:mechanosensitive ion channel domain-containing protein n=1 Tax=Georgenia sp. TF02-10 TaxID=2917725 RepID=UPI001FA74184|nr:mechanosensitive ion channel domain-containing protein [Georgenia sp. TF02-10]UNX54542.1 mechanosensitive ion channel [Georgenia sp. TF02-10]
MTIDPIQDPVDALEVTLWVAGGVFVGLVASYLVTGVLRVVARRRPVAGIIVRRGRRPIQAILVVLGAWAALVLATPLAAGLREAPWRAAAQHILLILLIAGATWFLAQMVRVLEDATLAHMRSTGTEQSDRGRRVQTQAQVLRRFGVAVVVILGVAGALLTFPGARAAGASLLASAGIVSVVAGLAAQTTLGNLFAGLQLAFTDALRVDDVVIVEGQFGHVEEITLTYVVVRLWDDRRMIMPSTFFTTTPFENWTRQAPALLGTVDLDLDWRVPVPAMRIELERILAATDMWDHRLGILQVNDAVSGLVRVRALVSAKDAPTLSDLRNYVREHLVDWVQTHAPYALPRRRIEEQDVVTVRHDAEELLHGEIAQELKELTALDGAPEPPDTLEVAQRPEDPDARRERMAAARRARRRAARADRRRSKEGGSRLGRPGAAERRPQPSTEATTVLDMSELGLDDREDHATTGSTVGGAGGTAAGSGGAGAGRDTAPPPDRDPTRPRSAAAQPRRTSLRGRVGQAPPATPAETTARTTSAGHEASVFTGSREAEERARAFTGPGPRDQEEREETVERRRVEGTAAASPAGAPHGATAGNSPVPADAADAGHPTETPDPRHPVDTAHRAGMGGASDDTLVADGPAGDRRRTRTDNARPAPPAGDDQTRELFGKDASPDKVDDVGHADDDAP